MNHITIELCAEDRERVDRLTEALLATTISTMSAPVAPQITASPIEMLAKVVEPAEEPAPWEEPVEAEEPAPAADPQPEYTTDDVRALVQKLAAPTTGKREEVKAIVKEYAESVRLIPADKYPEVMQKLKALEG